jgi:hypothetical protein
MNNFTYKPHGSVASKVPLSEIRGILICDNTLSLGTLSAAYSFATWKAAVDTNLTMYPIRGISSYEPTTDDPNILTAQQGQKYVTNRPTPSVVVYADINHSDYMDYVKELRGGQYGVIYYLKDGKYMVRRTSAGLHKPFPARIYAVPKGIPMVGDIANNFPIHIMHNDFDDFESATLIDPEWDFDDLVLATPSGLDMYITTAYNTTSGKVVVQINDRFGTGVTGFVVGDIEELSSNFLTSPACTAVTDNGAGSYDLTLQKNVSPANLAAGDYITIRVKKTVSTVHTYLSNRLTVVA